MYESQPSLIIEQVPDEATLHLAPLNLEKAVT